MQLGWKTGAIIPELKVCAQQYDASHNLLLLACDFSLSLSPTCEQSEMEKGFSPAAKCYLAEVLVLENMLKNYQVFLNITLSHPNHK